VQNSRALQGGRMGVTGALRPHTSALNDTCRQYKLIKRSNGPARLDARETADESVTVWQ